MAVPPGHLRQLRFKNVNICR